MKRRDLFKWIAGTCFVLVPGVKVVSEPRFEFETNPKNTYVGRMTQYEIEELELELNKIMVKSPHRIMIERQIAALAENDSFNLSTPQ